MELNRQFQFYDIIPIKDPQYGSVEHSLFSNPLLSTICSTPSYLIFNANTTIKILNKQFEFITEFKSYDLTYNVIKIIHINNTSMIATIAEKLGSPNLLKIWDLNKIINKTSSKTTTTTATTTEIKEHSYHSQVEISNGDNNFPITSFDSNVDFNLLVIGFSNGNVVLVRGDIIHDKGSRQRLIYQDIDPITGVFLNGDLAFITTISKVLTMPINGKTQPLAILDKKNGSELGNCTFNYKLKQLIVGNDKNLIFYNNLQKITTMPLSFAKRKLYNLIDKNYLLIISPITATTTRLIILDYSSRQIILNNTISSTVKDIFEWGNDLFLLSNDGLLFKLVEKSLQQQLNIIIQRDLYPIAIELAEKNHMNTTDIHYKYGNYLYEKSEFDDAMEQYMACLDDKTETSEIIKKFKNNHNLPNLIKYLRKMFALKIANSDHLTLLMLCYIKLKLKEEFLNLINQLTVDEKFDLNTVIQLCRDSSFYDVATKLANLYNEYQLIIDIQLNDLQKYDQVLEYCKTLSINDLLTVLLSSDLNLVKKLLDKKPILMTNLLIDVFTGNFHSKESDLDFIGSNNSDSNNGASENGIAKPTYLPPKPRLIFKSFINHDLEFVFFLESCIKSYEKFKGDENDKKDLIITLFEIYLSLYNDTQEEEWCTKAKFLIRENDKFVDLNQVLLLCQLNEFNLDDEIYDDKNTIDLYRSSIISKNLEKSIRILHKYGAKEHVLFKLALKFYCSDEIIYNQVPTAEFEYLFENIQKFKILTPLEIIEIMSLNEIPKIGILKNLLLDHIATIQKSLTKNEKLIESFQIENTNLSHEIEQLTSSVSTIQPTNCFACQQPLRLPVIHFKCSHSYHLNCLNDLELSTSSASSSSNDHLNDYKCPKCINELEEIESIRRQQEETSDRNDLFLNVINNESNDDNLQIITEFIGRGSLENLKYIIS